MVAFESSLESHALGVTESFMSYTFLVGYVPYEPEHNNYCCCL